MQIYGIAGTNGSGKDTVGHMLAERHGFLFVSMTDMLRDELARRGLPPAREHMRNLSAEWRRQFGLGVLVDKAYAVFQAQQDKYKSMVMASFRNPGEVDSLHKLGGKLIWVDADPHVRYKRIQDNLAARGELRAVDDRKTFDQFLAEEQAEMQHSGDEATLNMSAVKARADIVITNDSDNITDFKNHAEKILGF